MITTTAVPPAQPTSAAPLPAVDLTLREAGALLGALQVSVTPWSPLTAIAPQPPRITPGLRDRLVAGGWMTGQGQMTPLAGQALRATASPAVAIDLMLGTPDRLLSNSVYAGPTTAGSQVLLGPGRLTFLTVEEGEAETVFRFQPGRDPSVVTDSLRDQLMLGPMAAPARLRVDLLPDAFVTLLGVLDARLHSLLAARLDRAGDAAAIVTPQAAWEMVVEGRLARDLAWAVTLFTMLIPSLPWTPDLDTVIRGMGALVAAGHLAADGDRYRLSEPLRTLVDALYPLISFGCVTVTCWSGAGNPGSRVLALVRGRAAVLMVQAGVDATGNPAIGVDVLDDVEVAEVLFKLAQAPETLLPAEAMVCPTCGAQVTPEARFCSHCGTAVSFSL